VTNVEAGRERSTAPPTPSLQELSEHLATGTCVLVTRGTDREQALTAPVAVLSWEPPLVVVGAAPGSAQALSMAGMTGWVLHVVPPGVAPGPLASYDASGVAAPEGSATVDCRLADEVQGGTHTWWVGEVVSVSQQVPEPGATASPEVRFEFAADDVAYGRARELVLRRQYLADSVLDPRELGFDLGVVDGAAVYALTRLSAEGLVRRDPHRGYVVVPLDVDLSDQTFDARCAIEIGAVDLALEGELRADDLVALRGHLDEMAAQLVADRFVDFDAYLDANFAFHRQVVMLAGNAALRSAFDQLGIRSVMTRSFGSTRVSSQRFVDVQRELLLAIERRDAAAVGSAAKTYRDIAKERVRVILSQTGGRL